MIYPIDIPIKQIGNREFSMEVNLIVDKVNQIITYVGGVSLIASSEVAYKYSGDLFLAVEQNVITQRINDLADILGSAHLSFSDSLADNAPWTHNEFNELVLKVNELIGLANAYTPSIGGVYWGVKSDNAILTESQIKAGTNILYTPGADITIPFGTTSPNYLWASWPVTEVGITNYFINDFDFGVFGDGGTFSAPITIGNQLFLQTNYQTQIDTTIFKH